MIVCCASRRVLLHAQEMKSAAAIQVPTPSISTDSTWTWPWSERGEVREESILCRLWASWAVCQGKNTNLIKFSVWILIKLTLVIEIPISMDPSWTRSAFQNKIDYNLYLLQTFGTRNQYHDNLFEFI